MPLRRTPLLAGLAAAILTTAPALAKEKIAVFDFQLANLAQLPPTSADQARLPRLSDMLRQELSDSGKYEIVPITDKVKQEVAKAAPLRDCGGCAVDFAKELGADTAVTGQIQKVSDLILNINLYFKKVDSDGAGDRDQRRHPRRQRRFVQPRRQVHREAQRAEGIGLDALALPRTLEARGSRMDQIETSQASGMLDALLDRVEAGEKIVLLRRGRIAGHLVPPPASTDHGGAHRAAEAIKAMAKGATLGGIPIKDLIDDGRR